MVNLDSTLTKQKKYGAVDNRDEYQIATEFLDAIISKYPDDVAKIATETLGTDYSMASTEMLKKGVKQAMKEQNPNFVNKLAIYLSNIQRSKFADIETTFAAGGMTLETALGDLGYTVQQYNSDPAIKTKVDNYISQSGGTGSDASKDGDKTFDWTKFMDTTGKVAQSIFFLGSAFQKREDMPMMPTLVDSQTDAELNRQKLIRNIVIISILFIGLGLGVYFMVRKI
jgi:hypothetical protein